MTVLVEKSATTLEDGIKTLIESAITDYKKDMVMVLTQT